MKSYFQVARKYIPDSTESTPVVHTPEYSRLVTYDWNYLATRDWSIFDSELTIDADNDGKPDYEILCTYEDHINFVRLYIHDDAHLATNARADGFDIYFKDLDGNNLPFELVYYSAGTGEWWIDIHSLLGSNSARRYDLPIVNQNSKFIYYFYICYGDTAKNTDPTSLIWQNDNMVGHEWYNGLVAHTAYGAGSASGTVTGGSWVYETNDSSGRPQNSFTFDGHTTGHTSVSTSDTTIYDINGNAVSTYHLGNPCALSNEVMTSDHPYYSDLSNFNSPNAPIGYQESPWLPIYNKQVNGTYTADGYTQALIFAIKTLPEWHHSTPEVPTTYYDYLLAYRNIVVLTERNSNTNKIILRFNCVQNDGEQYDFEIVPWAELQLDYDTGYVFHMSTRDSYSCEETPTQFTSIFDVTGVCTNSLNLVLHNNWYAHTYTGRQYWDRVRYLDGIEGYPRQYPTTNTEYHHWVRRRDVNLLEVRSTDTAFPYKDVRRLEGSEVAKHAGIYYRTDRARLHTTCAMLFRNEEIRTIAPPPTSAVQFCTWNRAKTYQGLAGGSN